MLFACVLLDLVLHVRGRDTRSSSCAIAAAVAECSQLGASLPGALRFCNNAPFCSAATATAAADKVRRLRGNALPPLPAEQVVREAYPDHTQFEKGGKYYDASSKPDSPKWFMVDVKFERQLARQIPLEELKRHGAEGGPLAAMALIKYGRLSVQPVTAAEWEFVLGLEAKAPADA